MQLAGYAGRGGRAHRPRRRSRLRGDRTRGARLPAAPARARRRQRLAVERRSRRGKRADALVHVEQALSDAALRRLRAGAGFPAPVRLGGLGRAQPRADGGFDLCAGRARPCVRRHARRPQHQGGDPV